MQLKIKTLALFAENRNRKRPLYWIDLSHLLLPFVSVCNLLTPQVFLPAADSDSNRSVGMLDLPGPGGAVVLVGEAGQVLSDSGLGLRPQEMKEILLRTVSC